MIIDVKMFAAARQYTSQAVVRVELEEPANVSDLKVALLQQFPQLEPLAGHLTIAVDNDCHDAHRSIDLRHWQFNF